MPLVYGNGSGSNNPHYIGIEYGVGGTYCNGHIHVKATYAVNDTQTAYWDGPNRGQVTYKKSGPADQIVKYDAFSFYGNRGQSYYLYARADGIYNGGRPEVGVWVTIPAVLPGTPPPPGLSNIQANSVTMTVSAPDNGGSAITTYRRQFATDAAFNNVVTTWDSPDTNYTVSTAANTTYWVRYAAINGVGMGPWSGGSSYTSSPVAPPEPSNVVATRVSDTQMTLTWTNNPSSSGPYTTIRVRQKDNVDTDWAVTSAIYGSSNTLSVTGLRADRQYTFSVRSENAGGQSGYATSNTVSTTPSAPSGTSAAKSGANIVASWVNTSSYSAATTIQVWHAANGVWDSTALATTSAGATSYTHSAPSTSVTHTYRVRAVSANPVLYSAYSPDTNVVQLLSAPLAPTLTAPITVQNRDQNVVFTWTHNPVDTTAQTAYELRWRSTGTSTTWTTLTGTTAQTRTIASSSFAGVTSVDWEVRTKGEHVSFGPWSATSTFLLAAQPYTSITFPTDNSTYITAVPKVDWAYSSPDSYTQAAWEAQLLNSSNVIISTKSGVSSTTKSVTLDYNVANNTEYTFKVRTRSGSGLWSEWDSARVTVVYPIPPKPVITATFDRISGSAILSITTPPPVPGEESASSVKIYRRIPSIDPVWKLIGTSNDVTTTIVDKTPHISAPNEYRVISWSGIPSSSTSDTIVLNIDEPYWHYFNYGPNYGRVVRVWANPVVKTGMVREKELYHFADANDVTYPSELMGNQIRKQISVQIELTDPVIHGNELGSSTFEKLEELAIMMGPVLYRDPIGRRLPVSVISMNWSRQVYTKGSPIVVDIDMQQVVADA